MTSLRVGIIGGVPDIVGGGGLERQIRETVKELRSIGVDARQRRPDPSWRPHLIHAFSADPATWNHLKNSALHVPLVLSPVLVVESRVHRLLLGRWAGRRIGTSTTLSMRAELIERADHLVALNSRESDVIVRRYAVPDDRVSVIGNGSLARPSQQSGSITDQLACVGTVGDRKGQLSLLQRWPTRGPALRIIGPIEAGYQRAEEFLKLVGGHPNAHYLGELAQTDVWAEQERSVATISYSRDEGQSLALVDSLALGRPVLVRESDSAREFVRQFPGGARTVSPEEAVSPQVHDWARGVVPPKRPPTWADVARELLSIYERLVGTHGITP